MPIVYVHGVNTRTPSAFDETIEPYLRRYVAPVISPNNPDTVLIDQAYWGHLGVAFAFGGASRPASPFLAQGPGAAGSVAPPNPMYIAAQLPASALGGLSSAPVSAAPIGLISGSTVSTASVQTVSLASMKPDELSDALVDLIEQQVSDAHDRIRLCVIADELARDATFRASLGVLPKQLQAEELFKELQRRSLGAPALLAQGGGLFGWFAKASDRLSELIGRMGSAPAYAASTVLTELRKPLNDLISVFVGDVFVYLDRRLSKPHCDSAGNPVPGEIPTILLNKLLAAHQNKEERGNEPLIVLSHSMGGQIVYDAITAFIPNNESYKDIHVDFWCATASQIGFFEEAKLFLASKPEFLTDNPVHFPKSGLGCWWNVWDSNDVLSFTGKRIFQGIDDESYSSGMSVLGAHGGYLFRPSFYRKFAKKLEAAKKKNWRTN